MRDWDTSIFRQVRFLHRYWFDRCVFAVNQYSCGTEIYLCPDGCDSPPCLFLTGSYTSRNVAHGSSVMEDGGSFLRHHWSVFLPRKPEFLRTKDVGLRRWVWKTQDLLFVIIDPSVFVVIQYFCGSEICLMQRWIYIGWSGYKNVSTTSTSLWMLRVRENPWKPAMPATGITVMVLMEFTESTNNQDCPHLQLSLSGWTFS